MGGHHTMDHNSNLKLSADLIMHILECLDPVDILAMRATCCMFYRTAASKSVWLAALNRVCEQHGTYKPTYPTEKMTCAELEHAASGPHRFVKFVNKFNDASAPTSYTQPYLTRQFQCRRKSNEPGKPDGWHAVSRVFMIPGGRFLVTTADAPENATVGTACLWDLGYSRHFHLKPFPIATISTQSEVRLISACPSLNGKNVIVAIYGSMLPGNEPPSLRIYCIDPLNAVPGFTLLHEQILPNTRAGACSIYLNEPTIVVRSGSSLCVWNWAEGTGCQWHHYALEHSADILLCENTIIAIDDKHDFVIWDTPEQLPPSVPLQELRSIVNPPKRIRRQHESNLPRFTVAVTPSWQRHTSLYFSFVVDEEDDEGYENRVWLHSLRRLGTHGKAFVPTYLPVDAGRCAHLAEDLGVEIRHPISPLILCDGRLVLCSHSTSNEVVATVFPVPTAQLIDHIIDPRSAFLLQDFDESEVYLDFENVGFCPMSGRLVSPISGTSLQISDFLLPLDERYTT